MSQEATFTAEQAREILQQWKDRLFQLELRAARFGWDTPPEIVLEITDIRNNRIPALLAQLQDKDGSTSISGQVQREIGILEKRVEAIQADRTAISFVNREQELDDITNPVADKQIVLVEGPASYGKTYLIRRARTILEKAGWSVCQVDFRTERAAATDQLAFLEALNEALPESIKAHQLSASLPKALETMTSTLSSSSVALLLDSVEEVRSIDMIRWIRDQFIFRWSKTVSRQDGGKLKCVIAGRYIFQDWVVSTESYLQDILDDPIKQINLKPFRYAVILKTFNELANKRPIRPNTNAQRQIARSIQLISGGHPDCIFGLLLELDTDHALNPSDTYFKDLRTDLFQRHVRPACNRVLQDVPRCVVQVFPYLCMFRKYDEETVNEVLLWATKNEVLSDQCTRDTGVALQELSKRGLMRWDGSAGLWQDDVVRRILALQIWVDPKTISLARDLNCAAIKLYDGWLRKPPANHPGLVPIAVVEHIYHTVVSLEREAVPEHEAAEAFKKTLTDDLALYQSSSLLGETPLKLKEKLTYLRSMFVEDEDIWAEIASAAPSYSVDSLLLPLTQVQRAVEKKLNTDGGIS